MTRIWGTGLSFLLHASVAVGLGVGLATAPAEQPPAASVSPTVPMRLVSRVEDRTPSFTLPEHRPASSIIGTDGPIAFTPDRVYEAMELPEIPPPSRPDRRRPDMDRAVAPTALRISEPVARVTAPPSEIRNPSPEYPRRARRRGLEGTVTVEITVRRDGTCGSIQVVEKSGSELFVESVMEALRGWVFRPALREGVAVEATHRVRFRFNLEG